MKHGKPHRINKMCRKLPQSRHFPPTTVRNRLTLLFSPLQYGGTPGSLWGTPDGHDANTQKCFTLWILKHVIKICKCTTKEINKNSITKAALPLRGLNTRTGLITEHWVTLLPWVKFTQNFFCLKMHSTWSASESRSKRSFCVLFFFCLFLYFF